jgi:hypothetical protein
MIFTKTEELFLANPDPMIMKQGIFRKLDQLFGTVQESLKMTLNESHWLFPEETDLLRGKISRGENYLGLPWMMLDFPRLFSAEQTVALRTFFWWGNSYSCHLLISGSALPRAISSLLESEKRSHSSLLISTGSDPWKHHFNESEFVSLKELSVERISQLQINPNYLKLSAWFSLDKSAILPQLIGSFFNEAGSVTGLLKP